MKIKCKWLVECCDYVPYGSTNVPMYSYECTSPSDDVMWSETSNMDDCEVDEFSASECLADYDELNGDDE